MAVGPHHYKIAVAGRDMGLDRFADAAASRVHDIKYDCGATACDASRHADVHVVAQSEPAHPSAGPLLPEKRRQIKSGACGQTADQHSL